MDQDTRDVQLLQQILEAQREHLAEYRRVTRESLELQQKAVARQEQFGVLYRRVLVAGSALVGSLLLLLGFLLAR